MRRYITADLHRWYSSADRKPLILRGARQVGKTWVVHNFAEEASLELLEINFERNPEYGSIFETGSSTSIISSIEILLGREIKKGCTLLFLDEVQECPEVLQKLRWFYEDDLDIAVIAAGSLLDFVLEDHDFSMPVGRVSYMFLEPMSFGEFLLALGQDKLEEHCRSYELGQPYPGAIHEMASNLFAQYCLVGGMPQAVSAWVETQNPSAVWKIQSDLLYTYRDDFNKYRKRVPAQLLRKVMAGVARQLGGKFVYSSIDRDVKQPSIKKALELLVNARVCRKVTSTSGNGIPLGAEENDRIFKCIFLDVGLVFAQLGLQPIDTSNIEECVWANKGALAEQVVGQLLLAAKCPNNGELYYWQQNGSATGEIDYIAQYGRSVLPIEVKSGSSGSMKSLHSFMKSKGLSLALRFDSNPPSTQAVNVRTVKGEEVSYKLVSLPLYMVEFSAQILSRQTTSLQER